MYLTENWIKLSKLSPLMGFNRVTSELGLKTNGYFGKENFPPLYLL
jgi:hypothetical protein